MTFLGRPDKLMTSKLAKEIRMQLKTHVTCIHHLQDISFIDH